MKKKKIKILWLLQPPRSGGTLFLRLMDNNPGVVSYPVPLRFHYRIWPKTIKINKKNYPKIFKFFNLKKFASKGIKKQSSNNFQKSYKFDFNFIKFNKLISFKLKSNLNFFVFFRYFIFSVIRSWENYLIKLKGNEIILGHTTISKPKTVQKNLDNFFKSTKKMGYIILILRRPEQWLISSSALNKRTPFKSKSYEIVINYYIEFMEQILKNKNKNIHIILFEDLILSTRKTIKSFCKKFDINYTKNMLIPTMNGELTYPNSSFIIKKTNISKDVLKRSIKSVNNNLNKKLEIANMLYEKIKKDKK